MTTQLNDTALTNTAIATDEHRQTLTDAVAAAHLARRRAERELRRSELERDQTARALELRLHPLDERQREVLRIAYADAAASVAVHADAFEQAVQVERATEILARAFDPRESVLVPRESVFVPRESVFVTAMPDQGPRTGQRNALPFSGRSRLPSPDARALLR